MIRKFFINFAIAAGIFAFASTIKWEGLNYVLFQVQKATFSKIAKGLDSLEALSNGLTGTRSELIYGTQKKGGK